MRAKRIVRVLRIVMPLVATLSAVVLVPWDVVTPWLAPLPDTVRGEVERAVDLGLDGIIVVVDRGGTSPERFAAGWKDKEARVPADATAYFKIGSIHKLYVAAAVVKAVHAGHLSLSDTIADRLPDLAPRIENADRITVRMLVRHRSGIPDFIDHDDFDWFTPQGPDQDLAMVLDRPASFAPDARYAYSNSNYLLLGLVLGAAVGVPHEDYVARELLEPLGLTHTHFTLDPVDDADVVSGYWYGYDDDLRDLHGSMIATAEDVAAFVRALNDGSLLTEAERATYASIYEFGHTGWVPGYYSVARYHRDIDAVVVQFVNTTGGDTWGFTNVTGGKALGVANAVYGRIVRIVRRSSDRGVGGSR